MNDHAAINAPIKIDVKSLDPSAAAAIIKANLPTIMAEVQKAIESGGKVR